MDGNRTDELIGRKIPMSFLLLITMAPLVQSGLKFHFDLLHAVKITR